MKPLKERIEETIYQNLPVNYDGTNLDESTEIIDKLTQAILTEINNTRLTEEEWEKVVTDLMPKIIWGYICKECGGGGAGEERSNCPKCNGVGITDWQTKGLAYAIYEAGAKKLE